ncbi:uncharacterized protein FOMMEDRAFT_105376 [Fomitiporia mediterranea MF3/22]|uniref:uncharacterized protein n=1 Tax=Fomitiporia mediterranea (strain MF3/22) TaxID=694068 RepID=UPI0004407D10|nr:uncharacterized protein FOMMEDRAFT_105376 [Fomitiporia mediterranea MF3/22]EJD05127.1 hypothetical protein FOMMEDRAFT_105376 [Fomitiporia mediterranea MF3/22]
MSHVLLLRAPSEAANTNNASVNGSTSQDPYEKALAPATSVPVYETVQTLEELQWILETGPSFHGYMGVIVTSKRSVDAWAAAARKVPPPVDERAHWTNIPFYAVGSATGSAVRDLTNTLASCAPHLAPREVLGAEESGTGEQLAHFILARLRAEREAAQFPSSSATGSSTTNGNGGGTSVSGSFSSTSLTLTGSMETDNLSVFTSTHPNEHLGQGGGDKDQKNINTNLNASPTPPTPVSPSPRRRALRRPTKLLFLVGDKTRDALPTILSADDTIELDSVQVYATRPSPDFPNALRNAISAQPKIKDWWIALFAPSGADYAVPYLREHFTLPPSTSSSTYPPTSTSYSSSSSSSDKEKKKKKSKGCPPPARIAVIGPTTATHVREELKIDVAVVAAKPSADALADAIRAAK